MIADRSSLETRRQHGERSIRNSRRAGLDEPRAYALPWNRKLAKQLRQAQQQAEAEGTKVMVRQPFDGDINQMERVFYPEPRPAPPAKQVPQDEGPLVFKGSDTEPTANN